MTKKECKKLEAELYDIYNSLKDGGSLFEASLAMDDLEVRELSNSLAQGSVRDCERILELLIEIFKMFYEDGNSYIIDETYDILYEKNKNFNSENAGSIIRETVGNKKVVSHQYPDLRGTIQKVHFPTKKLRGDDSRKSYEDWLTSTLRILDGEVHAGLFNVRLMPKFDGVSVIFECEDDIAIRALTRGDTKKNEAIFITTLSSVGLDFSYVNDKRYKKYGVKSEIIMTQEQFKQYKEKYGEFNTPRSAISSAINSNEFSSDMLNYITIVPLYIQDYETKEILEPDIFFETYPTYEVSWDFVDCVEESTGLELFNTLVDDLRSRTDELGIPTDGIVIRVIDKKLQKILGRLENVNRYEVAYKFPPQSTKTKLKSVEFTSGLFGNVTPVAHFDPVMINGNKVKQASLGSIDRFIELGLRVGDEIIIKYDIIPYVDVEDGRVVNDDNPLIPVPTECLWCGSELVKRPQLKCVNVNCEGLRLGKIHNYVKRVKLSDISESTINKLYTNNIINKIEDLYDLESKVKDILKIDGFGEKKVHTMLDTIRQRTFMKDYEVLGSLGIESMGERMFKKITNIYYINEIIDICNNKEVDRLMNINGIGKEAGRKIIDGVNNNIELLNFLIDRFTIIHRNDTVTGSVIAFSKIRDKDMERHLELLGHTIMGSYNRDVGILIIPNHNVSSSKIEKAKKNNCMILSYDEACKYFNYKN